MTAKNKYTYDKWLNGDVILITASIYYNPNETKDPVIIKYSDFSIEDEKKVRIHQRMLFKERVKKRLDNWQKSFEERYKNSERKEVLTAREISFIEEVLFGEKMGIEFTTFEYSDSTFYNSDLIKIRAYAKNIIMGGNSYNCENIQIDNSKYIHPTELQSEPFAQALWEQLKILQNLKKSRVKKEDTLWFKIGLEFATGNMDKLLIEHNNNSTAISRALNMIGSRPYISDSIANDSEGKKNIFASPDKTKAIISYCQYNGIDIVNSFYERIKNTRPAKKN